jgi:hypothetical protein
LKEPDNDFQTYYDQLMNVKTLGIGSTLFVLAGQEINFEEVLL